MRSSDSNHFIISPTAPPRCPLSIPHQELWRGSHDSDGNVFKPLLWTERPQFCEAGQVPELSVWHAGKVSRLPLAPSGPRSRLQYRPRSQHAASSLGGALSVLCSQYRTPGTLCPPSTLRWTCSPQHLSVVHKPHLRWPRGQLLQPAAMRSSFRRTYRPTWS